MAINDNEELLFVLSAQLEVGIEPQTKINSLIKNARTRVENEYNSESGIYPELSHDEEKNEIILTVYRKPLEHTARNGDN